MMYQAPAAKAGFANTLVAQSLAEYEAVISDEYAPLTLIDGSPCLKGEAASFQSEMASRSLGWMRLSRVYANSGFSAYRKANLGLNRSENFILMLVEKGWFSVTQHGRNSECGAESIVLMDCDAAMDAQQVGATRALAFRMPKAILRAHNADIDTGFATAVNATQGCAAILRDLMLSVWRNHETLTAEETRHLPNSLFNLINLVFLSNESTPRNTSPMAVHYERIMQAILADLSNPELSPGMVADKLGISKSYLFAVTNWGGSTFRRLVMVNRLEHCCKSLANPAEIKRSITDIALGWGFQNSSHFSRCFTERYGVTPTRYREQVCHELALKGLTVSCPS